MRICGLFDGPGAIKDEQALDLAAEPLREEQAALLCRITPIPPSRWPSCSPASSSWRLRWPGLTAKRRRCNRLHLARLSKAAAKSLFCSQVQGRGTGLARGATGHQGEAPRNDTVSAALNFCRVTKDLILER